MELLRNQSNNWEDCVNKSDVVTVVYVLSLAAEACKGQK